MSKLKTGENCICVAAEGPFHESCKLLVPTHSLKHVGLEDQLIWRAEKRRLLNVEGGAPLFVHRQGLDFISL